MSMRMRDKVRKVMNGKVVFEGLLIGSIRRLDGKLFLVAESSAEVVVISEQFEQMGSEGHVEAKEYAL